MRFYRCLFFILLSSYALALSGESFATTHHHAKTKTHTSAHKSAVHKVKAAKHTTKKKGKKRKVRAEHVIAPTISIQQGLDQIIGKFHTLKVGVVIEDLNSGNILYQYNGSEKFLTASTLKVFTAATALSLLGPNYIFPTQILTNGSVQNGVLQGNLYVRFTGDPELIIPNVEALIIALARQGIHHVTGSLVIDDTATDHENMAPGWMMKEELLCYASPSNAIILNRNCFGIGMAPAKQNGAPPQVNIVPNLANLSVINDAATLSPRKDSCAPLAIKSGLSNNTYILEGCIAPKHSAISVGVPLNDTRAAGTSVVINLLQKHGILITGDVLYGKTPAKLHVLAEHDSKPLSELVTRMLKKSDNLIAGILFKAVGGAYYHTTGTWENGAQAVQALLSPKAGINFDQLGVFDGAGLSRYNQVSPIAFGKLLRYAYYMPYNNIFYKGLPCSGVDGTLRGRLGGATAGKVHAKTGTMDAISGLAGYVETRNHGRLIFAILVNDPREGKSSQGTYRALEDRIVQFIALHQPVNNPPKPKEAPLSPPTAVPAVSAVSAKVQEPHPPAVANGVKDAGSSPSTALAASAKVKEPTVQPTNPENAKAKVLQAEPVASASTGAKTH